ncbi:MAG: dihydrofolate reductase family protein [Chitinophagaceae bacterium]
MRKLKLQMNMTLDGFVGGPEGQLDWMTGEMEEKQLNALFELTDSMDTIIMGRKMTAGFTQYWEEMVNNQPDNPEFPYAKMFVDTPKIVFSKTQKHIDGKNVTVENGDLLNSVNKLKHQEGKDIIVYGGANFVSQLIKNGLIDELYLFINPVVIGNGLSIFKERFNFELISSEAFESGVMMNKYKQLPGQTAG